MQTGLVHDGEGLRRITRGEDADAMATAAFEQVVDLLGGISPEDWQVVTPYRHWTVRDTVIHLIGIAGAHSSALEYRRQLSHVGQHRTADDVSLAALQELHHLDHGAASDAELIVRLRTRAPRAVAGRSSRDHSIDSSHDPAAPEGSVPAHSNRRQRELGNVLLARDVWIHRLDIATAVGRTLPYDARVDGVIIADLVSEWYELHGAPVILELTGPFGGRFTTRQDGIVLRMDALDFCRIVMDHTAVGPVPDHVLLAFHVPV